MSAKTAPTRPGHSPVSSRVVFLATLVIGWGLVSAWPAASATEEPVYGYALAHELMSPFCPGRTLAACTSEQAAEMRQWILLQEAGGATREEVIAVLESKYGDQIRSAPVAEGWGLAAWLLPGAAVAVGALLAVYSLRKLVGKPRRAVAKDADPQPERAKPKASGGDQDLLERMVDAEFAASRR